MENNENKPVFLTQKIKLLNSKKINEVYEYCGHIGRGNNSSVYKVKEKATGRGFAVKDFSLKTTGVACILNDHHEISILSHLKHENIVNFVSVIGDYSPHSTYMVMEYCRTDLADYLEDSPPLRDGEIKSLMLMLFNGLAYLHNKFIIHRDISPTNILLNSSGILKIADFGTAIVWEAGGKQMDPSVGTRWYRAPELLFACNLYTVSVDMWAAGCIFAELLLHKPLFPGDSEMEQICLIIKLLGTPDDQVMPGFSSFPVTKDFALKEQNFDTFALVFEEVPDVETIELVRNLLTYDFLKRFNAGKCLLSSYFQENTTK